MKVRLFLFIPRPSALILFLRRRSQVVRQSSAKALFIGSIPIAASKSQIVQKFLFLCLRSVNSVFDIFSGE